MYTDIRHDLGAYAHAHSTHVLPAPNADIQRKLHRLIQETGLAYDKSFAERDPRLQHCMLLAGAGLLVTATRAQAPLLTANCADLACLADLNVLLLRFCSHPSPSSRSVGVSACLLLHDKSGQIIAREGYRAIVPPHGGLLLRHASQHGSDPQAGP